MGGVSWVGRDSGIVGRGETAKRAAFLDILRYARRPPSLRRCAATCILKERVDLVADLAEGRQISGEARGY